MASNIRAKEAKENVGLVCRMREIQADNVQDVATVTRLHMELLHFGPMAQLGEPFLKRLCYETLLEEGLMRAALYEVEGQAAGFIVYTARSITFHRSAIRNHWLYVGWLVALSVLRNPRLIARVIRAVKLMFSRRAEETLGRDPMAEVLAIGVLPEYRSAEFVRQTGLRIADELVAYAAGYFQRAGLNKMRMIVDTDNRPTLLFYHRLGARFEPYEQAGKEAVYVWFNLLSEFPAQASDVPACWSLSSRGAGVDGAPSDWETYWEGLDDHQMIFRAEAKEYLRRLEAVLPLDPAARVLDFGCGFGFTANALAPKVAELFVWDAAANMRRCTRVNVASHRNVRFVDLSDPENFPRDLRFDLILVNSVMQYMSDGEISRWLARWREMLYPEGILVISDLIPPDYNLELDPLRMLVFSARRGFILRAFWEGLGEIKRYSTMRSARPLWRAEHDDLRLRAEAAGLRVRFLPSNLTYRSERTTVLLSTSSGNFAFHSASSCG